MSFAFKRNESVAEGVCRIARKQIGKAVKCCSKNSARSIHATRKRIKKIRALLRLVRCAVSKKQFDTALADLREAAGYLAAPRDAHVKQQALEKLAQTAGRRLSGEAFSQIRALVKQESAEEAEKFHAENGAQKVRRILRKVPREFERLHFKEEDWGILGPALKRAYKAAQQARDCVIEHSIPEKFHQWRKRAKDLLCTVELLEPIWPEQMSALSAELEKLTELLGDDHDLEMLRQTVVERSVNLHLEGDAQRLLPFIEAHQTKLRKAALKLGNGLFAEKSSIFSDRLHQYWKRWKSKKPKRLKSLAPA
jgi:CHAD domain-containing protein